MPPSERTFQSIFDVSKQKTIWIAGVPEHFNLPWHLASEKGRFQEAGLNVSFEEYSGGTGAMTKALRSGEADMAVVLTEGIVADIIKGNPSKILQPYVLSPLIWGIHVAANSDLEKVEDIRGKTYAISRFGSGSHLMAIVDAVDRGWDPAEMDFELIRNLDGARKALPAGQADIFFWERFMTQPYVDLGEFKRIGVRLTPWPCFMIAARESLIEESPEAVRTILSIINEETAELATSSNAVSLIADRYELATDEVEHWLSRTEWNHQPEIDSAIITTVIQALAKADIISQGDTAAESLIAEPGNLLIPSNG